MGAQDWTVVGTALSKLPLDSAPQGSRVTSAETSPDDGPHYAQPLGHAYRPKLSCKVLFSGLTAKSYAQANKNFHYLETLQFFALKLNERRFSCVLLVKQLLLARAAIALS